MKITIIAYATTPNLGQGAFQSIESSMAIANCLARNETVNSAFMEFQRLRMKKAVGVVRTSWRVGKLAHIENSFLVKLRNFFLKRTPRRIMNRQSAQLYKIDN